MQNETRFGDREVKHRGSQDCERPKRRAERGCVNSLVERLETHQSCASDQCDARPQKQEQRHQDFGPKRQFLDWGHSITSPRMRNFAIATVAMNPSRAMISDNSK